MLNARRTLYVDDGSVVELRPELSIAWPEVMCIIRPGYRMRAVYHDQSLTISTDEAATLAAEDLLVPRHESKAYAAAYDDVDPEVAGFLEAEQRAAPAGRFLLVGEITTTVLDLLMPRGSVPDMTLVSSDAAGLRVAKLLATGSYAGADVMVAVGDVTTTSFPGRFTFTVSGLGPPIAITSLAAVRRHLRAMAVSVASGGRYLFHLGSVGCDGAERHGGGPATVSHDPAAHLDLVQSTAAASDSFGDRYTTAVCLSLDEWRVLIESTGCWQENHTWQLPGSTSTWLVLSRTDTD